LARQLIPIVLKVSKEEIKMLKVLLLDRPSVEQLTTTNQYELFRVKFCGCLIIGYSSGKIVSNKETARELISELLPKVTKGIPQLTAIGSDEVGKGEWLGPMVVAAVATTAEQINELQAQGVMDSKELSLPRIRELARYIIERHYLTRHITPRRFNELYDEFKDEKKTLNDLLAWGHSRVIGDLLNSVRGTDEKIRVIIDEFDKIKTEARLRGVLDIKKVEVVQYPKAEENMAVAAASIVARDLREDYIDLLCKKLQRDLRTLAAEDAAKDENAVEYAKVSFLKKLTEKRP
jgi:ribonuclease HIII